MSPGRVPGYLARSWLAALLVCLAICAYAIHDFASGLLSEPGATFTLPAPRDSWTLIAYGDTRFTDPADQVNSNPKVRQILVEQIAAEKPTALIISGDMPLHGADPSDYAVFTKETTAWREQGLKLFPALGNHEFAGCGFLTERPCLENWWSTFPELRGRRWYSVRIGEVYIVTLDSNMDLEPGSAQTQWLARQLKKLPKEVRFVFVSLHHPPVADPVLNESYHNARPNEQALAQQLEAAASRHKHVRFIVIAGHIHNYERFKQNGVEYLVAGGGGATPYRVVRTPKDLYQDNVFPNYHYVKFVFNGETMQATMYRLNGQGQFVAGDSFELGNAAAPK